MEFKLNSCFFHSIWLVEIKTGFSINDVENLVANFIFLDLGFLVNFPRFSGFMDGHIYFPSVRRSVTKVNNSTFYLNLQALTISEKCQFYKIPLASSHHINNTRIFYNFHDEFSVTKIKLTQIIPCIQTIFHEKIFFCWKNQHQSLD